MYEPLPKNVTIRGSGIHGLGLFATTEIPGDCSLGVSHIKNESYSEGWIRTPLGGFYNHSDDPNCRKLTSACGEFMELVTLRPIWPGEELTVAYTLYSVT